MSSCDIENQELVRLFRSNECCGRTRETVTTILHTLLLDSNTTYLVWPLYLVICMGEYMVNQNDWYIHILNKNVQQNAMTDIFDANCTAPKKRVYFVVRNKPIFTMTIIYVQQKISYVIVLLRFCSIHLSNKKG